MSFCTGLCATTKSIAFLYRDRNRLPRPLSLDGCGRETGFVELRPTEHRAARPRPGHLYRSDTYAGIAAAEVRVQVDGLHDLPVSLRLAPRSKPVTPGDPALGLPNTRETNQGRVPSVSRLLEIPDG